MMHTERQWIGRFLDEAVEAVQKRAGEVPRPLVVVTGTGLTQLADALAVETRIRFSEIPHMPHPRVAGHRAEVVLGKLGPLDAFFFCGRVHLYEGWSPEAVAFPVRLGARLGGQILLVTNATGGVHPLLAPGDLVLLRDQINLTGRFLLSADHFGQGSPSLLPANCYDPHLAELMHKAADDANIILKDGIYAANLGPTYETRAESAWLAQLNADVVGMSTVHETLAAHAAGMRVVGLSCVANRVPVWGRAMPLSHEEVVEVVSRGVEQMKTLIRAWSLRVASDANG